MPIHDWTRVEAGIFHGFHLRWISHFTETLNAILPKDHYAHAEQHMDDRIADVLTLRATQSLPSFDTSDAGGGTTVLTRPKMEFQERMSDRTPRQRQQQRHVVIRHVSDHRVIVMIEIVSPANKDRRLHREAFVAKGEYALRNEVNLVVIDLFPPTAAAPNGLPGALWRRFERAPVELPATTPVSVGSFVAAPRPRAYFTFAAIGQELPATPLYLDPTHYINVPLAPTYAAAFAGSPAYLRELLAQPV